MSRSARWPLAAVLFVGTTRCVHAGMPSPELVLTELGKRRFEELSFFVVGFLVMTALVQWLWNYARADIAWLPRLTYRRTAAGLVLWGLVMTVVLTLISGARELMTPAAWEPNGITYKLAPASSGQAASSADASQQRRARLDALRFQLWRFAGLHDGRFPGDEETSWIRDETWRVDPDGPMKFIYRSGLTTTSPETILVYEPEIYDDGQLVLMTSGRVATLKHVPAQKEQP